MKKYTVHVTALLVLCFLTGCQCSKDKSPTRPSDIREEAIEQRDSVLVPAPDETDEEETAPGQEEVEAFYQSLPVMALPANWETDPEAMAEVPQRIYMSDTFGFMYPYEAFYAVRLPERNGLRFVLVHLEDMGEFVTLGLFVFNKEMKRLDYRYIYTVREIDGGQNVLVKTFVIGEDMEIAETSEFHGRGPEDEYIKVIFQKEYFTPLPDGGIRQVVDSGREIIRYTEEEIVDEDGDIYGTYNFTITTLTPSQSQDGRTWEYIETTKHYGINDESQLVGSEE